MVQNHEVHVSAWLEAERRILAHFSKNEIPLDLEILRGVLADMLAALQLGSCKLFSSIFIWLVKYTTARSQSPNQIRNELQYISRELNSVIPCRFSKNISDVQILQDSMTFNAEIGLKGLPRKYFELILDRDGAVARELIHQKIIDGFTVKYIYHRVLRPVLFEIGRLWLGNAISVADEHYATAVTQSILMDLHSFTQASAVTLGRVLLSGVQRELHDLGIRMIADFLEMDGWDTIYYGPNLPLESLLSSIEKEKPDLIALSITVPAHLIDACKVIESIQMLYSDRKIPILVGGYAFLLDRSLFRTIGADACAVNLVHATRVARKLLVTKPSNRKAITRTRNVMKESHSQSVRRKLTPVEELIRLNSELGALHRQLAKRNAVIEELHEEKNRFIGMAAHDLRNAIQIILNSTRLLEQTNAAFDESQRKLIHLIESSSLSMADLVSQYLDVSKIEAGKLDLHPKRIDLTHLVEERLEVARLFADRAGVNLRRSGEKQDVYSFVDPARVSQALDNIVLNAVKFSSTGSEVEVKVTQDLEVSVISVTDHGPGLSPNEMNQLFLPFGRLKKDAQFAKPGTGLGLYIAKKVIDANGGKIWATSKPSLGSTFFISFPLSRTTTAKAG
jgi:signal transduction histidine kinase